jgi:hypothetical protein
MRHLECGSQLVTVIGIRGLYLIVGARDHPANLLGTRFE